MISKNKLIVIARYWNDIEWVEASLEHIDYWGADKVYICEGNWDQKFSARSVDGTREICQEWVRERDNACLIDNPRDNKNYRINQANTSNMVMELAGAKPGDWMMIIDCDHFYFKQDIDNFKKLMGNGTFSYPIFRTLNFYKNVVEYFDREDSNGTKLPYEILDKVKWIPTNHLSIGGKMYSQLGHVKSLRINFDAYHYVGLRLPNRLHDKYEIGDRKSPEVWKDGILLKNMKHYQGGHPEFVIPTLKKWGWLTGGNV